MTSFILKCIAMISMLIDHTSVAYFGQTTLFNVIEELLSLYLLFKFLKDIFILKI